MPYESKWISLSEALATVGQADGTAEDLRRALFDGAVKARGLVSSMMIDLNVDWWTSDSHISHDRNEVEVGSPPQPISLSRGSSPKTPGPSPSPGRAYRRAAEVVLDRAALLRLWPTGAREAGNVTIEASPAFANYPLWSSVDHFTIEQAAALWAGIDPAMASSSFKMGESEISRFTARKQMLVGAVMDSTLQVQSAHNTWARLGDHDKSLVSRNALVEFAIRKNERPSFLFDTLLNPNDNPETPSTKAQTKNRVGRPVEYDWNAMTVEVIRIADLDALPEKQSDLVRRLLEWFQDKYDAEPAESAVKTRVSRIYRGLARGQKFKDD